MTVLQSTSARKNPLNGGKFLCLGFAALILLGTILLALPVSSATSSGIGLFQALFTATSSVCVTGLTVINAGQDLSRFGQVVLMLLIQVGGLGFLVFSTLLFVIIGKRITLKDRLLIRESMNTDQLSGLIRLVEWAFLLTISVELTGAAILSIRLIPRFGWGEGIFMSVFHAVSAFCNAGFDLLGSDSLISLQSDPLILFPIMLLITTGGLGFALLSDLVHNRRFSRMAVHTRLVLLLSAIMTVSGTLFVLLLEWNNPATLGALPFWERIMNALFQSVSLRTAGFASIDQAALRPATKLLSSVCMLIGAAPASTGGGVKLTTFACLILLVVSIARGREHAVLFRHTIPRKQMERAACVFLIAIAVVFLDILLLSVFEPAHALEDVMYEAISAVATVGLSCNMTGSLSVAGRIIIIITMFIGRVGPLTLALAIGRQQSASKDKIRYPEAQIMIG